MTRLLKEFISLLYTFLSASQVDGIFCLINYCQEERKHEQNASYLESQGGKLTTDIITVIFLPVFPAKGCIGREFTQENPVYFLLQLTEGS